MSVPFALIFSGTADGVTPAAEHHTPIYNGLASSCKNFVNITGGGHCYYAQTNFNCDFGESTSSPNISIDVILWLFKAPSSINSQSFSRVSIAFSYDLKESQIELIEDGLMRELERSFLLQKIDSAWKDHLQSMNALRETIAWRGYGQKDPLIEYKNEAYILFTSMVTNIRHSVTYLIFRSQPILKV